VTRIIVFGAGAIGSVIAGRLMMAGQETAVVARGAHLAALRANGLLLEDEARALHRVTLECGQDELRPADVVLVTLKSYALPGAAATIARHRAEGGFCVFLQNGVPWWYFRGLPGGGSLPSLDPAGALAAACPTGTIAGGVTSLSATLLGSGHVRHTGGWGVSIGYADGTPDRRLNSLAEALRHAGMDVRVEDDPRPAVWTKLTANVALNGVAALTGAAIGGIWSDDGLRPLVHHLAEEVMALAAALGCPVKVDMEQRRRAAAPAHKSSTLQDIEGGRPIEYEALFGALLPLADQAGVPIPHIRTVAALLRRRALELGCLPP
jgi:2-dehydropantoate 2-reductase